MPAFTFTFRKSTYSDPEHECVEVATNIPTNVAIRDSKAPGGAYLTVDGRTWEAFLTALPEGPEPWEGRITGRARQHP
jgi:Domain of unknown function (DUF397)